MHMFTVNKHHTGKILRLHRTSVAAFSEAQASSPGTIKWRSQSTAPCPFYCYQYKNATVINALHSPKPGASNLKVT